MQEAIRRAEAEAKARRRGARRAGFRGGALFARMHVHPAVMHANCRPRPATCRQHAYQCPSTPCLELSQAKADRMAETKRLNCTNPT